MRNYLNFGPVSFRISSKGIARWGYPMLRIGGLEFGSRTNSDDISLASYHPRRHLTWLWYVHLRRRPAESLRPWIDRAAPEWRRSQWHDYYRLPFGWQLIIGQQDYHRWPKPDASAA